MKIRNDAKQAIGKLESELNQLGDWSEVYPVINGNVCVGVVSAFGTPGEKLAGEYHGEHFDETRQAYID